VVMAAKGDDNDKNQDPCAGSLGNKVPVSHPVNVSSESQDRRAAAKKAVKKGTAFIPKPLDAYGSTSVNVNFCVSHPGATKDDVNNAFKEISAEHLSPLIELTAGTRASQRRCPTPRRSRRSRAGGELDRI